LCNLHASTSSLRDALSSHLENVRGLSVRVFIIIREMITACLHPSVRHLRDTFSERLCPAIYSPYLLLHHLLYHPLHHHP
jgi:hypothetical protein